MREPPPCDVGAAGSQGELPLVLNKPLHVRVTILAGEIPRGLVEGGVDAGGHVRKAKTRILRVVVAVAEVYLSARVRERSLVLAAALDVNAGLDHVTSPDLGQVVD